MFYLPHPVLSVDLPIPRSEMARILLLVSMNLGLEFSFCTAVINSSAGRNGIRSAIRLAFMSKKRISAVGPVWASANVITRPWGSRARPEIMLDLQFCIKFGSSKLEFCAKKSVFGLVQYLSRHWIELPQSSLHTMYYSQDPFAHTWNHIHISNRFHISPHPFQRWDAIYGTGSLYWRGSIYDTPSFTPK